MRRRIKKIIASLSILGFAVPAVHGSSAASAAAVGEYQVMYRGANTQIVTDVAINRDNGDVYAVGHTFSTPSAGSPITNTASTMPVGFISKITQNGTVSWTERIGRALYGSNYPSIARDTDGSLYIAFGEELVGSNVQAYEITIEKWTAGGVRMWRKTLTEGKSFMPSISVSSSGVYVAYSIVGAPLIARGEQDGVVARLNKSTGALVKRILFGSIQNELVGDVEVLSDGSVAVVGSTEGKLFGTRLLSRVDSDFFVYRLTADLVSDLFTKQWGTTSNDRLLAATPIANAGIIVAGDTSGSIPSTTKYGRADGVIMSITSSGVVSWSSTVGSDADEMVTAMTTLPNGNIMFGGWTGGVVFSASAGDTDGFVVTIAPDGRLLYSKQFGTSGHDSVHGLATRADGSAVISGWTAGSFDGQAANGYDGYVLSAGAAGATGMDLSGLARYAGSISRLVPVKLPVISPISIQASENSSAVALDQPPVAETPPLCNEAKSGTVRFRREVAICAGLTFKKGTTTKIRLSTKNAPGVCSLSPRRRLKLNKAGTCKVKIRVTQTSGSTKAVWVRYKVS